MSKKLALIDKQQVDNLAGWLNFAIMRLRLKGATQRKIRVPVLPTFRPNSRQLNDFQLLLELEDRLIVAKDAFLKLNEVSLSPAKLLELIERETKDWNPNQQQALVRQCLGLRGLMTDADLNGVDVLQALSHGLKEATELLSDPGKADVWDNKVAPCIAELLESRLFRVATKSANLAYDYANLLRSARIITDVRPVFDDSVECIEGAVVSHVLRLKYTGLDDETSVSIVLDAADVERLQEECNRALSKGKLAQEWLSKGKPIQCHITGTDGDDKHE